MKVAERLEMLELPILLENGRGIACPVILHEDERMMLVDAGLPRMMEPIKSAMEQAHLPFRKLTHIAITHHDLDHIGCLADILEALPRRAELIAYEDEKPYIQGEVPPVRLALLDEKLKTVPEEKRLQLQAMRDHLWAQYTQCRLIQVDKTVKDGEVLPLFGGIECIHTPGHTIGHLSLYHCPSKTLIAGDVFNAEDGQLRPAPLFTIVDKAAATHTLNKLTKYDIEAVVCYHGGLVRNANSAIAELAHAYDR